MDPFDSVFLAENRLYSEGYKEGFSSGRKIGCCDGVLRGNAKGIELGDELGYYIGFTETLLKCFSKDEKNKRKIRALSTLLEMVQTFQHSNVSSSQYQSSLSHIRTRFRQTLSLCQLSQALHPYEQNPDATLTF